MLNNIIQEILIIRTPAIVTIVVTAVLLIIFLLMLIKFDTSGRKSRILGLFVGLTKRSALHLSFSWTKYIFFVGTLCAMQYATLGHYLIIGILIVVSAFLAKEPKLVTMEVVGGILSLGSTWVCSVFVDYMTSVRSDLYVLGAYWVVVVFMIMCSTVVFLYEVISISQERSLFETNWNKK